MWFYKVGEDCSYCRTQSEIISPERFLRKYLKHSPCRLVEPDVCCVARASLQKGKTPFAPGLFMQVSDNKAALHLITLLVLMRLQGLRCGRVITPHFPSARNTMIKLKVSDSRCAPFSRFNYVQLLSARAPRCCSSCVGYCSSVKRLFFNLSVNHTRLMMAK